MPHLKISKSNIKLRLILGESGSLNSSCWTMMSLNMDLKLICVISRTEKLAVRVYFSCTNITFHFKGMWLNSDKCKPVVPGLRMLRQENYKFKLGYKQDLLFLLSNPHPLNPQEFYRLCFIFSRISFTLETFQESLPVR